MSNKRRHALDVDLKNELVFARITFETTTVKQFTGHKVDCFDGYYGLDTQKRINPVNITQSRFTELFYNDLQEKSTDTNENFKLDPNAPELILRPGGHQKMKSLITTIGSETKVLASDFTDASGSSSTEHGYWGNLADATAKQLVDRANSGSDGIKTRRVLIGGGRGWMQHPDVSFSVLEIVTENLEKDLGINSDCFDSCTLLQMRLQVVESLDIGKFYSECNSDLNVCAMTASQLTKVLNTAREQSVTKNRRTRNTSKRNPHKFIVEPNDLVAIEVEYNNLNASAESTVFCLHFKVISDDDVSKVPGYSVALSEYYNKQLNTN